MAQDLDFIIQGNGWQNVASNTWLSVLMQKNFDGYMSQRPKYVFTKRSCHSNWIYHDVKKFVATERIPLFLLGISLMNDIVDWFLIKLVISILLYIIEYFPTNQLTENWCYKAIVLGVKIILQKNIQNFWYVVYKNWFCNFCNNGRSRHVFSKSSIEVCYLIAQLIHRDRTCDIT